MKNFIFTLLLIGGIYASMIFVKENFWLQIIFFLWLFVYGLGLFTIRREEFMDAAGHIKPLGFVGNIVICRGVSLGVYISLLLAFVQSTFSWETVFFMLVAALYLLSLAADVQKALK